MDMFKASFMNKPTEAVRLAHQDFVPSNMKKEKVNPESHSILPLYRMIEETTIPELEDETLFFIFYFQQAGASYPERVREVPCRPGA